MSRKTSLSITFQDIRSFFNIDSKRKHDDLTALVKSKADGRHDSKNNKKKRRIIESDDEEESVSKKSTQRAKEPKTEKSAKEVKNVKDLFGGPVKRKDRPKESPKSLNSSVVVVDDVTDMVEEIEDQLNQPKNIKESPGKENRKTIEPKEVPNPEIVADKVEPVVTKTTTPKKSKNNDEKDVKTVEPVKHVASHSQPVQTKQPPNEGTVKSSKSADLKQKSPAKTVPPSAPRSYDYSFVDKYKPTNVKSIIGQQGPQSNANKLQNWLLQWHKNHSDPTKKKKANPYARDNDGSSFKAALLSGPPGIGKTTTAHLVCKELLFDVVEFNASDTRSKKLLKEEVSQLMSNTSLKGYLTGDDKTASKRHVLIMDEVDGMAGNEDRGGIAELIQLIKESQIPIICMCNDRSHPKMRSLVNYCFDLRFNKPSVNQIRSAMMSICFKEGIKLDAGAMDAIINGTGNDVRQTLNHLALYSATKDNKINTDRAKKNAQMSEKDVKIVSFFFSYPKSSFIN